MVVIAMPECCGWVPRAPVTKALQKDQVWLAEGKQRGREAGT